ncbi:MAG: MFS transporter [Chloroflexota bacterium]|nr:MAG: MFS transporter [Chloroflexota bacterium]
MIRDRSFLNITIADLVARLAYQMGKTPLLPIFAASLGASDAFLGIIVSVSTLTGMILKPFIGILSDRWGRRLWLLVGTAFFALMPFTYWLVHTPTQLFLVRIIHGTATAIYGPVTLAYVTEQSPGSKAERLGWFGMARSAGYIVGPALAGFMLLRMQPAAVFTVIGLLSAAVFLPILALPESRPTRDSNSKRSSLRSQVQDAVRACSRTPAVWLSGGLEAVAFIALYATKAFMPLYALSIGINVAVVGLFFALQEALYMILKPLGGRFGDRLGYLWAICLGMLLLGMTLPLLPWTKTSLTLLALAGCMGLSQAVIFPSTTALVSAQIDGRNLGAGMGMIGALRNAGKVLGPLLAGLLIRQLDFGTTFNVLGIILLLGAMFVLERALKQRRLERGLSSPAWALIASDRKPVKVRNAGVVNVKGSHAPGIGYIRTESPPSEPLEHKGGKLGAAEFRR